MQVKVANLALPMFQSTVRKLHNFGGFPVQVAMEMGKITKECLSKTAETREKVITIAKEHAETTETGDIKLTDAQEIVFKGPEHVAPHQEKFEKLMESTIEFNCTPIKLDWLNGVGLSPVELDTISQLLTE